MIKAVLITAADVLAMVQQALAMHLYKAGDHSLLILQAVHFQLYRTVERSELQNHGSLSAIHDAHLIMLRYTHAPIALP